MAASSNFKVLSNDFKDQVKRKQQGRTEVPQNASNPKCLVSILGINCEDYGDCPDINRRAKKNTKHILGPHLAGATVSGGELMRGNAERGEAEPLRPETASYNGLVKKGQLCSPQHRQVPL